MPDTQAFGPAVAGVAGLDHHRPDHGAPGGAASTLVDGAFVIRPCFINARTTLADVDAFVDTVVRFGDDLTAG